MKIEVEVLLREQIPLPKTAVCRVEVRDVSLLDVSSKTINSYKASVTKICGITLLTGLLNVPDNAVVGSDLNVWAHLSLTGSKRILSGDYITMCAYPIKATVSPVRVVVELHLVQ